MIMSDNSHYWKGKHDRIKKAKGHVALMKEKYGKEIDESKKRTIIYDEKHTFLQGNENTGKTQFVFTNEDTVSALMHCNPDKVGKMAILNFASYKMPGGFFLAGSGAQEECLCHESTLYNVLVQFEGSYYNPNKKALNRALYKNRALYSPDIVFTREKNIVKADVITCAAPNRATAQRYQDVSDEDNSAALLSRIEFIRDISLENHVNTLILGAWGCGVFGQDYKEVADMINDVFKNAGFKYVICAVPGNTATAEYFERKFKKTS